MTIRLIAAVSVPHGIYAKNGMLPWSLQDDMNFFKETTMGSTIIMGRATWQSLGRKSGLPGRENIVISSSTLDVPNNVMHTKTVKDAISMASREDIYLIGGRNVWREAICEFAEELLITEVLEDYSSDTVSIAPELIHPGNVSTRIFVRENERVVAGVDQLTGKTVQLNFVRYTLLF